jgi:RNA-directed DNA polymerase
MAIWRAQHFKEAGLKAGVDPVVVSNAVQFGNAIATTSRRLVPVFTLKHLAHNCGVPYELLRKYVTRDSKFDDPYRVFRIQKRSPKSTGGTRTICVPAFHLAQVQRYIHANILSHLPVHQASIAYKRHTRIVDEVGIHCECRWLVKLDMQSFFESIPERLAYRVFRGAGYPALLSFEMARLCTRVSDQSVLSRQDVLRDFSRYSIASYSNLSQGALPQGAATSPLLANLVARDLDNLVANLARDRGMEYTRYADDITLSTADRSFSRAAAIESIRAVYSAIRFCGFEPNTSKTVIVPPGGRKVVLGLLVDGPLPRLQREFRSRLQQHLYYCLSSKVGPVEHARARKFAAVLGFKNHLRGLIAYAAQVEPEFGAECLSQFEAIKWPL